MKTVLIIMLVAFGFAAAAQTPTPEADTVKGQSKQTDPEPKQEPAGLHYIDESVRIAAEELPPVVLDSLKKLEPQTWEKSVVYKQVKEDTYLVEIRDGGQERSYRFDKEGKKVKTMDKQRKDEE